MWTIYLIGYNTVCLNKLYPLRRQPIFRILQVRIFFELHRYISMTTLQELFTGFKSFLYLKKEGVYV